MASRYSAKSSGEHDHSRSRRWSAASRTAAALSPISAARASLAAAVGWIAAAGLRVLGRLDTRPRHGKAQDAGDPLPAARAAEVTSLWRLAVAQ